MVANIADFYYIITKSEIDARSLENNLIKKYKPKYNILLKDDKTYSLHQSDRRRKVPGVRHFPQTCQGQPLFRPYMGGVRVKDVLEIVQHGVRRGGICSTAIGDNPKKTLPELPHTRCAAPCAHLISPEEYGQKVKAAMRFLDGDDADVEQLLREKMQFYAENEEFELALDCRNKLENALQDRL